MAIKAIYSSKDEIPEKYQDLYTEREGRWELTGVEGFKTQADVDRVQEALRKEKSDHAETRDKLKGWAQIEGTPEEVQAKLDKIPELETAAAGKLDDEKINELADKRAASKVAPLERENKQLKDTLTERDGTIVEFQEEKRRRTIHDSVRAAASEAKLVNGAVDDALMLAERVFEVSDDGKVVTRDNVGVTPGLEASAWLSDMQDKRPHWWPPSQGGGAGGGGGGGPGGNNPWSKTHWNLTEQGRYINQHGQEKAEQMARAAGSRVGATAPPA